MAVCGHQLIYRQFGSQRAVPLHDSGSRCSLELLTDRGASGDPAAAGESPCGDAISWLSSDRPARVPGARVPACRSVRTAAHGAPWAVLLCGPALCGEPTWSGAPSASSLAKPSAWITRIPPKAPELIPLTHSKGPVLRTPGRRILSMASVRQECNVRNMRV